MRQWLGWLGGAALACGVLVLALQVLAPVSRHDAPAHSAIPATDPHAGEIPPPDLASSTDPSGQAQSGHTPSDEAPSTESQPATVALPAAIGDGAAPITPAATMPPELLDLRIEADGLAVLAGRAAPGAEVSILAGTEVVETALAGPDGQFVAILSLPPSEQPRELSLQSGPASDPVSGEQSFLIAPTLVPTATAGAGTEGTAAPVSSPPLYAVETAAPQTVLDIAPQPDADAPAQPVGSPVFVDAPGAVPAVPATLPGGLARPAAPPLGGAGPGETLPAASDTASGGPAPEVPAMTPAAGSVTPVDAPAVLIADRDGVRLLRAALAPDAPESLALDTISYDDSGMVEISGRAGGIVEPGQGFVRLYLDNIPVATDPLDAGQWSSRLSGIDPGLYTLRVDRLDPAGAVVSRVESPFLREPLEAIAAAMADQDPLEGIAVRTVQPGHSLWAIARERYGEGILYVQVFEANRDRIRNPDLIYPGQVFVLPEAAQVPAAP